MVNRLGSIAMTAMTAALALAARDATAKCAMTELQPSLVTDKAATVPSDGGVLVGFVAEVGQHRADGDPSVTDWKFSVAVDHTTLAPGLTVYRPKSGATIAISDAKGKAIAKYARDAKATTMMLPPPMPQKLTITASRSGRGTHRELTAALSSPPPDTAVAVILYSSTAGKALAYGRVHPGADAKAVVPWADPPRCSFSPSGTTMPTAGDKLVLAWVDQFGRIGKTSAPIGFTETKVVQDDGD